MNDLYYESEKNNNLGKSHKNNPGVHLELSDDNAT